MFSGLCDACVAWGRRPGQARQGPEQGRQHLTRKLYEIVYEALKEHIRDARLPHGLVLLEGPVAELFRTSRAPVKTALHRLNAEGLIERFDGRGFVVANPAGETTPLRMDLAEAGLVLDAHVDEQDLQARSSWERIYDDAEREIGAALPFGRFHINEAKMGEHFDVSRTVIRDVLGRMHERGLVEKSARSHWIAGPLTASAIREFYEIRGLLEPQALVQAVHNLDIDELVAMRDRVRSLEMRYPHVSAEELTALDTDLHTSCVQRIDNKRLAAMIRQAQLPLVANHTFLRHLGIPEETPELGEHKLVFEHLIQGSPAAAAAALKAHLERSLDRALIRLKVLSVKSTPPLAPYFLETAP
jgi:DNA-binding GntR family transcriptional regulator